MSDPLYYRQLERIARVLRGEYIVAADGDRLRAETPQDFEVARRVEAVVLEREWDRVRWVELGPGLHVEPE